MTLPLLLTILVLGELPGSYFTMTTVGDLAVLEGQSVTVPCHYNPQYISHVKYWCYGRMKDFCSSLARTDDPTKAPNVKGRVTIADDPSQHVFTVSMQDLTEGDSGWYWCGVELGGMWVSDSTASLYISVIQGVSVVNSMVSGDEGRSVTVQCLYSKNLRSSEKRWCRSGNWNSCMVTDSEGTFSSGNVLLHDDKDSMFTVTLTQLEMRDSGWYWCGSGQQHGTVHVSVTPQTTTRATVSPVQYQKTTVRTPSVMSINDSHSRPVWESPLVVFGVVLLVMIVSLAFWKLRKQYKKKQKHQRTTIIGQTNDNLTMCPWTEDDYKNTSVIFLNSPAQQVQML
ncbi:polymeric immunoglobulin receptor [Siphateles boraxobius]|uniref:polymeric immunoglobulin receptor n=1 Tax=Siphateles boraxobius TaxID=180520 RepID=UPI00406385EC